MTAPIRLSAAVVSGDLSPAMQQTVREQIQAHVRAPLIDVLLQRFADQIHGATLGLLARVAPAGVGRMATPACAGNRAPTEHKATEPAC